MRFPGRIHHFCRIQAVNLERYIAAQDIKKVHGTHVPRYENGVFQQISRSQISQVRSQPDVGSSRESEPQKFSARRIRAEDPSAEEPRMTRVLNRDASGETAE